MGILIFLWSLYHVFSLLYVVGFIMGIEEKLSDNKTIIFLSFATFPLILGVIKGESVCLFDKKAKLRGEKPGNQGLQQDACL